MSRFIFGLALSLGLLLPLSLLAAEPAKPAPRCALLDPDKLDRVAILEAKLSADPTAVWVERKAIEQVLKEQQVQTLFSANGVGQRAKLGRLLKADVLVMIRRVKDVKEPTYEVIICESAGGLRLLVRGVAETKNAADDVEALRAVVTEGLKKFGETAKEVVAVPPFLSNNLTFEHDYLKGAFAKLVEQVALTRPGVVAVELAEAEALAKELALTTDEKISRPLPIYFVGEFRHDGRGAEQTITVKLRAERGGKTIGKPAEMTVKPEAATAAIQTWVAEILAGVAGDKAVRPPADSKAEARRLGEVATSHLRLGNWAEALPLLEAGLLLDPEQDKFRADALDSIRNLVEQIRQSATARARPEAAGIFEKFQRRGLEHLEAAVNRNAFSQHGFNQRSSDFLGHVDNLYTSASLKALAEGNKLRTARSEVLLRLISQIAKTGKAEEYDMVRYLFRRAPTKERYFLLEKLIIDLQDLPNTKFRTIHWISLARQEWVLVWPRPTMAEEEAALAALLDRLEMATNKDLQAAAAEMRRIVANEIKPAEVDKREPIPEGLVLRPIEFVLEGGGQRV